MWNFKLRAGNFCPWNCQNATLATHPKTQLATHLKTQNCKKCCVDANSRSFLATHLKWRKPFGNAPQNTNPVSIAHSKLRFGSWQRTWNYKTHLKSHCRLPCQRAAGMTIWEGNAGRGETPKQEWRVEKQQETRKPASQSWFWMRNDFKKPKHTKVWSRNKREHLQNKIAIKRWTTHLDFWKTEFTATQQGRTKNDIIQNEQLATVALKFKSQVADKSEIKSTTLETCIFDNLKFSSLNVADNILCM